jgi:hypothetical protein
MHSRLNRVLKSFHKATGVRFRPAAAVPNMELSVMRILLSRCLILVADTACEAQNPEFWIRSLFVSPGCARDSMQMRLQRYTWTVH